MERFDDEGARKGWWLYHGRLPNVAGFGVERYADTIGAALAVGATAGVAAHDIATGIHQIRERRKGRAVPVIETPQGGEGTEGPEDDARRP